MEYSILETRKKKHILDVKGREPQVHIYTQLRNIERLRNSMIY